MRELSEPIDPSAPVKIAKRLGLQRAKALHEAARQRLMMNASALEQARDDGVDLTRSDGLHKIRSDIGAERLHERRVLFALRDHDNVEVRRDLAEFAKRVEPAHAGHLFIEEYEVEAAPSEQLGAVLGVRRRFNEEAFVPQEHAVRLEELGFVVDPEHGLPVRCHVERM